MKIKIIIDNIVFVIILDFVLSLILMIAIYSITFLTFCLLFLIIFTIICLLMLILYIVNIFIFNKTLIWHKLHELFPEDKTLCLVKLKGNKSYIGYFDYNKNIWILGTSTSELVPQIYKLDKYSIRKWKYYSK